MGELDPRRGPVGVQEVDHPAQAGHVLVGPQPDIAVADPAFGRHAGRLDEDQTEPAEREPAQVGEVVVADEPVGHRVLAHRRDDQPVRQGEATEGQGREEGGGGHEYRPTPARASLFRGEDQTS
jgi:hypothetical protein